MNAAKYRNWFIVGSLVLMLAATAPILALFIHIPSGSETFSELWLLDPKHNTNDYPFNVKVKEIYTIYAVVGNHLGYSAYYRIYVKFRNQTQPSPSLTDSTPSPVESTYEFQFFLANGKVWESPATFSIQGKPTFVSNITINGIVFPVNCSSTWSSTYNGYFYQLFFELWLYDIVSNSFKYHERFAGIWLNMTM